MTEPPIDPAILDQAIEYSKSLECPKCKRWGVLSYDRRCGHFICHSLNPRCSYSLKWPRDENERLRERVAELEREVKYLSDRLQPYLDDDDARWEANYAAHAFYI